MLEIVGPGLQIAVRTFLTVLSKDPSSVGATSGCDHGDHEHPSHFYRKRSLLLQDCGYLIHIM